MLNAVVDLSHHNGTVDLGKAKAAGVLGVIHKASQGLQSVDPAYAANRKKARRRACSGAPTTSGPARTARPRPTISSPRSATPPAC
ncbi:MAG: GH25 family lysozyme [Caulobacteraceae bacterium]